MSPDAEQDRTIKGEGPEAAGPPPRDPPLSPPPHGQASSEPRRPLGAVRVWFRRLRIAAWLLLLAAVCAGLYLNRVGLPEFLKQPLLEQLRQRGVELQFTRLRWAWYRGLVADNVRFGRTAEAALPVLTARQAELRLDPRSLARLQVAVTGLILRQGHCAWTVSGPGEPPRQLTVQNIQAELRFLPGDVWSVEHFQARLAGVDCRASGALTNASALRQGSGWPRPAGAPVLPLAARLRQWSQWLEPVRFPAPPSLLLELHGDARDLPGLVVNLTLSAPGAVTPWGQFTQGRLVASLRPHPAAALALAQVSLEAASADTPWARVQDLQLTLRGSAAGAADQPVRAQLELRAAHVRTDWLAATNAQFSAHWLHAFTNPIPLAGQGELLAAGLATPWGSGRDARLSLTLAAAPHAPPGQPDWAWWTNLQPYALEWRATVRSFHSASLAAQALDCHGSWRAPQLTVSNLSAHLHGGALQGRAQLDVATRALRFALVSSLDPHGLAPLLPEQTRRWLEKCAWADAPHLRASGTLRLPAWTDRQPDWQGKVWPTCCLAGEFALTNGAYLGRPADWARSRVTLTNRVWQLPDLEVGRPEGQLRLAYQLDDRTGDYSWRVHSTVDPRWVRPLLASPQQAGLDLFTFTHPPVVEGEVWGRRHAPDRIGFRGRVALSNFTFRGETVSALVSGLAYTNQYLELLEPRLWRGTEHLRAAGVAVDFAARRVHITNGIALADATALARAIGAKTARTLQPYHFSQPPRLRVEGTAPFRGSRGADLVCDVAGGPFRWWRFSLPEIAGRVHWHDFQVTLTNVSAAFYEGRAAGWGVFDSAADPGTDCRFQLAVSNVNFRALMADLSARTNRLEGTLQGSLTVTRGNSADWRSWNGHGRLALRDGWIWEIPLFGVLSPVLDAIVPGLGNSRVSEGTMQFDLVNGVVSLDTLEMRAPAMRLQYRGTVDLEGRVDAVVRAELLRDAPLVGRVVSLALWPLAKALEYKITGTLQSPNSQPLYIPRLLLLPLNPFRLVQELFSADSARSNAPPAEPAPPAPSGPPAP